jgi:hypothetical protein
MKLSSYVGVHSMKSVDGKPISRILSSEEVSLFAWMTISLGFALP